MIDHDRLFKELLTTFFVEFIELFLPEVATYLSRDSIVPLDKEVFTDVTVGPRYETDILMQARFKEEEAYFLIHLENQSQSEADFDKRMFRYFARLHEKHDKPIYPIVLFSHDTPLREEPNFYRVEFTDLRVLEFKYKVIQLNRLNWRDFLRQPNPVASALMAKMQIAPEDRPKVKLECLRMLIGLGLSPAKKHLISGFVDIYLQLNPTEQIDYESEREKIEPSNKEEVMQLETSWSRQGRKSEAVSISMRLLNRKVGPLGPEWEQKLETLSLEQLEALSEALLDFSSMTDLTAWLESQQ